MMKPIDEQTLTGIRDRMAAHAWDDDDLTELVAPRFGIISGLQDLLRGIEALRALDLGTTPPAGEVRLADDDG